VGDPVAYRPRPMVEPVFRPVVVYRAHRGYGWYGRHGYREVRIATTITLCGTVRASGKSWFTSGMVGTSGMAAGTAIDLSGTAWGEPTLPTASHAVLTVRPAGRGSPPRPTTPPTRGCFFSEGRLPAR
jgi:hypothetical protein